MGIDIEVDQSVPNEIVCNSSLLLNQLKASEVERIGQPVLDLFLAQLALELDKTVGSVETNEEQCEAFNSLADSLTLSILNNTLTEQEKLRRSVITVTFLYAYNINSTYNILYSIHLEKVVHAFVYSTHLTHAKL